MKDPTLYFKVGELKRLFDYIRKKNVGHYALFFVLYHTGRRISELTYLRVNDIDFDKGQIVWRILKRREYIMIKSKKEGERGKVKWVKKRDEKGDLIKKIIKIRIDAKKEVLKVLKAYIDNMELEKQEKVFPMSRQNVFKVFKRYCKKLDINKLLSPHSLRHSFAIHFVEANPNMNSEQASALQHYLQHKNIDSTYCYLQFDKDKYKKSLENMPDIQ